MSLLNSSVENMAGSVLSLQVVVLILVKLTVTGPVIVASADAAAG